MNLIVHKTFLFSGQATLPGSKSQTVRGILLALLAEGESVLTNILDSEDTQHAMQVAQNLGAKITRDHLTLHINSPGIPLHAQADLLFTGSSGITTRFILPMLGFRQNTEVPITVDCSAQMRARPIRTLVEALRNLGMHIEYAETEGACPLTITQALRGGKTEVEGLSSQYLSALLLSLPCAPEPSEVRVQNLHERPYVEMTLHWLDAFGMRYAHTQEKSWDIFKISGNQKYSAFQKNIAGDFSSASYLIAAAALNGGQVELQGLDMREPQGDKRLVEILQAMGADIEIYPNGLCIRGGKPLTGISIDANDIPDLLPTLAVVGTQASGKTEIRNVPQARIKETDRIHSMTEGLSRMGAHIEEFSDGMTIYPSSLNGALVRGFEDHRTVMALSLAGMQAEGATIIDDAEAIDKTFPTFVTLMRSLGANMELSDER